MQNAGSAGLEKPARNPVVTAVSPALHFALAVKAPVALLEQTFKVGLVAASARTGKIKIPASANFVIADMTRVRLCEWVKKIAAQLLRAGRYSKLSKRRCSSGLIRPLSVSGSFNWGHHERKHNTFYKRGYRENLSAIQAKKE